MIGIISAGRQIGGAEVLCIHLANWLKECGEDAWLWIGSGGDDQISPIVKNCHLDPIGIRDLEWSCARSSGVFVYGAKLIGQNKGLAKRINNAPTVVSYFGGHNPDYADTRELRVDKFLFESNNLSVYARRYLKVPDKKIFNCWVPMTVPNGGKETKFFSDKFVFGCVGRLVENKNVLQVIQAFRLLNRDDTALVIVGDGWAADRKMLQHTAAGMKNVLFTGLITDRTAMVAALKGFDCLISASRHEGIPVTMREAMLLRTPVIGTEGLFFASDGSRWPGGAQELLADNRGLLNVLNDIGGYVECMKNMIENKKMREGLAENALKYVVGRSERDGQRLLGLLKGK
jgi:glycosyltransferase involved in cell wall biosynthesis